ncbi:MULTISPECIES: glycosyltransferase family 2 protein [unclassified Arthrobacter]|uniref:glycosyltransferase family 2 protein n=1 Tax=unclassified Arthrobacter TaxID=235627 RepID=UPI0024E01873|nr:MULTISPECIES: glycosyltransferase family 2 protein [unclassified Arthrobacter]MCC9146112.1 glycosyltransferase family 2 protein [Arthrobacter sp. zg-Y919]MDK1277341.1 glycosyltransferase family 2 protein [Arthrobacter sp. zg.Y919]WIB04496.1 glycosyltransferase family 2 protein [Arthrobacter sp. zg-Y919]
MHSHVHVCAVVVAHNGAAYLPETLSALTSQTRPADFYIGVDAGSTDASASLLQLGLPVGSPVIAGPARGGFGAAVKAGLAELPGSARTPHGGGGGADAVQEWIWLLHDDSAPDPGALEELLLAVERAPSVTIAGAKQVEWVNDRRLVDVGVSINRWAERLTLIDADELDQGQYDFRSDIFAVNSAGMLVRRDVWDALGGFDPALPGSGDDIDLCWRNRLAGNRVVVVPSARMRHAGNRPGPAASAPAARKAEIYLRLKHAPLWQVPFLAVGAVLGGIGRFFLGMVAKDPGYAISSLITSTAAVLRPVDLYRSRRQAAATRKRPRSAVNALRSGNREVREHRRSLTEYRAAAPDGRETGSEEYVPSGDTNNDFAALAGPGRAWVGLGALMAALLLTGISLAGLHRLFGSPAVAGGALVPLGQGVGDMWAAATGWWAQVGSGAPAHGDPFNYVLSLLAVAGFGNGNAAVLILLLLALPLAGLSAWFAAGAFTGHRGLRFWAAIFWAAVPAFQVALGSGRLGALIVHILLPLAVLAMARAVGAGTPRAADIPAGAPSWTAAAAAGLLLAAVSASAPLLFVLAAVAVLLLTLGLRRRARTLWWSLLPAAALLLPQVLSAAPNLRAVLADPGVPLAFVRAEAWQQLLGYPLAFEVNGTLGGLLPGGPWNLVLALVVGGPVVLLAALALFRPASAPLARLSWLLALAALALSAAASYIGTAAAPDAVVTAFTGPLVSASVVLLLCPALAAAGDIRVPRPGAARNRRLLAAVLGTVLAVGPAASLGLWVIPQFTGSGFPGTQDHAAADAGVLPGLTTGIQGAEDRTLPATAADAGRGDAQSRSLVLHVDADGNVSAALMRGGGTTLEQHSTIYAARDIQGSMGGEQLSDGDQATADLRQAVAVITAGTGVDPREDLARLGVAFVVLQESDTAAELLAGRMDSVPGLSAVGQTGSGWLWRVSEPLSSAGTETQSGAGARVRIHNADGSTAAEVPSGNEGVSTSIPAGDDGRLLVLAERADAGWRATLNGQPLTAAEQEWAQAFELPAEGGELNVDYVSAASPWLEALQVLIIGLTLLLALPTPSGRTIRLPGKRESSAAEAPAADLHSAADLPSGDLPDGGSGPAGHPETAETPVPSGAGPHRENRAPEGRQ